MSAPTDERGSSPSENEDGWRQVRFLVTGGAGFIGSHLVDALASRGDQVVAFDDLSSGSESNLDAARPAGARLVIGDVADAEAVARVCADARPDLVFHLAAQADVRRSVADPAFDAMVNVLGTINVLEAARTLGDCGVVFAATGGAVYGEGENRDLPFAENVEAAPLTPYGASKLAGEGYLGVYDRLHGVPGTALRFGNVYGPRQDPHGEAGVVAIFCGKLLDGERPIVFGDGRQTRDYVYVADAVSALIAGGDRLTAGARSGGLFNVGTGAETSVLELIEGLVRVSGAEVEPELAPPRAGELRNISIDPGAAARELGWSAEVGLEEGLSRSFEHVRQARGAA